MNEVILILSEDGTYKRDIAVFHDNGDTSRFNGYGKWKADKDSLYFYDSYSICNVCQNKNQLVSNKTYQIKKINAIRLYILVRYYLEERDAPNKPYRTKLIYDEYEKVF